MAKCRCESRRADASLIGVNQRDLVTFQVDTARAVRVAAGIPDDVVAVAESGITGPGDARTLPDAGYHAVLVGEHLVTSADPALAAAFDQSWPDRAIGVNYFPRDEQRSHQDRGVGQAEIQVGVQEVRRRLADGGGHDLDDPEVEGHLGDLVQHPPTE